MGKVAHLCKDVNNQSFTVDLILLRSTENTLHNFGAQRETLMYYFN